MSGDCRRRDGLVDRSATHETASHVMLSLRTLDSTGRALKENPRTKEVEKCLQRYEVQYTSFMYEAEVDGTLIKGSALLPHIFEFS